MVKTINILRPKFTTMADGNDATLIMHELVGKATARPSASRPRSTATKIPARRSSWTFTACSRTCR
ncbi:hypothetical protein [Paracoccus cavernae]|uniref:hypothetical protein n=1 Tax=Paracoccus cavernae TaxID=1571207 RepID=UPI0036327DA9